jgi:hypothetical protein
MPDKIKERINQALASELATEELDINVDIDGNNVVLSGVVDVLQDKLAAERSALKVAQGLHVENRLAVSTDGTITDKEVKEAIERKLHNSGLYVPKVDVHKGRVSLLGTVETEDEIHRISERVSEVLAVKEIDTSQMHVALDLPR